jgi:hypothetical protein
VNRTGNLLALTLAASMPVTGCATTYLGGEYRTKANELAHKQDKHTLAKGSEWLFFWGLLDSGKFNLQKELRNQLREDECVTDLEVKDRLSVGGFFLWIITAGIISHHTLVAKGHPAVINRPAPEPAGTSTAPRERETIIVPAAPVPAGSGRADRSADYNEGFRDAQRDRASDVRDRPMRSDRSGEYNDGYRDGIKDASRGDSGGR